MSRIDDPREHAPADHGRPTTAHVVPLGGLGAQAVLMATRIPEPGDDSEPLALLVSRGALHAAEAAHAEQMPPLRRETFVAGRVALRAAIASPSLGAFAPDTARVPLLSSGRGAPLMPPGITGSLSHKRTRAIAIAGLSEQGHLGVDLESRPRDDERVRPSIASRILTPREQDIVRDLDAVAHRDATVLRFSLKEAIYKAIDPVVQRHVRFTEVEVDVHDDGRASVTLLLPEFVGGPAHVDAWWQHEGQWVITTARFVP